MRVFLGLGDLAGCYSQFQNGLNALGVPCTFINAYPNILYHRSYRPGVIGRAVEWLGARRVNATRGSIQRGIWTVLTGFGLAALLVTSLFRYDVFIFAEGTSFFRGYDLWLLKLFRKRVIVLFHGSDSRPPYINGAKV